MNNPISRRALLAGSLAAGAVGAVGWASAPALQAYADQPPAPPTPGLTDVLGTYGKTVREQTPRADGIKHVDTPAQIAKLQQLHVNTYAYLIYTTSQADWDDLVNEFLPATQAAQISVWVYLVPPTEAKNTHGYPPFGYTGEAYIEWATAIADLSKQYSVLTAWVIDDFDSAANLSLLTPAYTKRMHDAASAINPGLEFFPILYPGQYTTDLVDAYAPAIDGAIYPYKGNANYDLNDLSSLKPGLDLAVEAMTRYSKRLYLMPYVSRLSHSPTDPAVQTVADTIQVGLDYLDAGKLDGVMLYQTPMSPVTQQCPAIDTFLALSGPWGTDTPGGDFAAGSQSVTVDASAATKSLTFQENDTFGVLPVDEGYYIKQLLVGGSVVWSQDIAKDPANTWTTHTVDLTSVLAGASSTTVMFRLLNPKSVHNFGATYRVSGVTGTGVSITDGNFADASAWATITSTSYMEAVVSSQACDPERQQHIFETVQAKYGSREVLYLALVTADVPTGLKVQATVALRQRGAGRRSAAASITRGIADQATDLGLSRLARQADLVAAELGA